MRAELILLVSTSGLADRVGTVGVIGDSVTAGVENNVEVGETFWFIRSVTLVTGAAAGVEEEEGVDTTEPAVETVGKVVTVTLGVDVTANVTAVGVGEESVTPMDVEVEGEGVTATLGVNETEDVTVEEDGKVEDVAVVTVLETGVWTGEKLTGWMGREGLMSSWLV